MSLQEILGDFELFRFEEEVIGEFVPKLQSLLLSKKDITLTSFFNEFYEYFAEDVDYDAIVPLFEEMWKAQTVRKKREKYILSHWFYYQAIKVIPDLIQEQGLMAEVQQMIDKKEQCGKTIDNISKKAKFKADQKAKFQANIQNSQIYNQCSKFLVPSNSNELSPQKIQQKHEELIYIIQKMRSLGESAIQYQLQKHILVSFQTAYKKTSNQGADSLNKLMEIKNLFDLMRQQNRINDKIRGKIQDFKLAKDQKSKYNILEGIKSELTVLDAFLLEYLISLSKKNSQLNTKKQPKNIVLLVGPSGSGKTTIILRLLGYKLIQTEIQQLPTLQPQDLRPQHSALRSSPQSISTTRYMYSTKIPKTSFSNHSYEDLQICDSPGFEDSAGCEVDISNSTSIQTFLMSCMSVKLVVVISQRKVGDKMEGIRQIAKIVSNLVVKYSEIQKDVSIILNKFDSQAEYDRIKPALDSVLNNLTPAEQSNVEYMAFLKSLAKRFQNKKKVDVIRFHPQETDIQEVMQQMKQGKIMNPRGVFKYSLSTKSNQCIMNRKTTLVRFIREYIGKDNKLAFYYLNQLTILDSCLNNQPDIHQEIQNIKKLIKKQVHQKFKTFEKKIDGQILQNDANSNTFKDLNKIKEQVKTFEVFTKFVDKLTTVQKFQTKVTEVKTKMLENLNQLSFQEATIQQSKHKVINTIKFFSKFQPQLQKSVLGKLFEAFELKKKELKQIFDNKIYERLRSKTTQLKNIFEIMQKGRQSVTYDENNPEKIALIDKKQLSTIKQVIIAQFDEMTYQSTSFIQSFKKQPTHFTIKDETVQAIQKTIAIFERLEDEGPILNQIYAKNYKNKIIITISHFGKELIQQCNRIFDPNSTKEIESGKIEYVRHNKTNTLKLKQIKGVYAMIGDQIDRLWNNLQRFISIETQRLNSFLSQLKSQKMINRNTLKNFKTMIDRVIKFSQGDDNLVESISQLKMEIKKSLVEHIKNLKTKVDKVKITLKLKRTLELEQLIKLIQRFKEIEAFYKTKQFNQQTYLAVNSQSASRLKKIEQQQEEGGEDYEGVNMSNLIKQMYTSTIRKMLTPFVEITDQSRRIKTKGVKKITLSYLQTLNDFIQYKYNLFENDIISNRDVQAAINKLNAQEDSVFTNIRKMLEDLKYQFDQLYQDSIEEKETTKQIYKLQVSNIKQFKRLCNIVFSVKKYSYLQELFVQQGFTCKQYIGKIVEMLRKSQQLIITQLANRKKSSVDYMKVLLQLQVQVEQMKNFDDMDFQNDKMSQFEFGKIYNKITQQIKEIEGKQSNAITNLFKDDTIILSDVRNMYKHLSQDELKNQENLSLIQTCVKTYADKMKKMIHAAKQEFKNDQVMILENPNANTYINRLEKTFKFYQELKQFIKPKFLDVFSINEGYFATQIGDLQIEQRLKSTYEAVKGRILSFEYKTKPRQFQKIISIMKKTEYVVQRLTKDKIYSRLYSQIEDQEKKEMNNIQDLKANKFSQRLKYFMNKTLNQVKDVMQNKNNESKFQFLSMPNFISMYNNMPQDEKNKIDTKIQTIMLAKLQVMNNAYQKNQEEKKVIEEDFRKTLDKLPNNSRKYYREKLDEVKHKLKQREQQDLRRLSKQLSSQSSNNVFQLFKQFQSCKNPTVQKEYKNNIEKQLKALVKEMNVIGANKKMLIFQSFKRYLKYFGFQNAEIIQNIKNNQKIKSIFSIEQKSFLNNLISEQKDLIHELDGDFIRCSVEGFQSYNKKSRQLSQLYVLALEDEYQGMCIAERKQLKSLCEEYIKKMDNKIQQFGSTPDVSILHYPATKVQKIIIQLKLIRIYINNFLDQSGKIMNCEEKRFTFIQETNKRFTEINIDSIIMKNLSRQINKILTEIRERNFYDEEIKILNFASLQTQFEKKLINSLKIAKEYEEVYNQYLCQREQEKYQTKQLIQLTQSKWEQNMSIAIKEFEQAITYPEEQISQRLAILHNLTQIINTRKWEVIDKSLKSKEQLQILLDSKFNKIKEDFKDDLAKISEIMKEKQYINKRYQQIRFSSQNEIDLIEQEAKANKDHLLKVIEQTVDLDAKERLTVDSQNIESFKNEKIQAIKTTNYNNFLKEKERNDEALALCVKNSVVKHLIIMKKITHSVNWKTKENQNSLNQFLDTVNKQAKNIDKIIFKQLNLTNNNYALIIAAESDIFKSQAALDFKNRTSKQGIDYILQNCPQLKENKILREDVMNFYQTYQKEYDRIIEAFKANPDKQQIDIVVGQLKDQKNKNQNRRYRDNIHPALTMARIFATWSMTKVDLADKENIQIVYQPHPAQVVAIYLLIGLNDSAVNNSLIQVLTGQGKSIVLAGLCIYLALKGYRPYCACYSEYLSTRDQQEFKDLFNRLEIQSKIKYGTFGQHCEEIINESSPNPSMRAQNIKTFREHMKSVIQNRYDRNTLDYFARIFDQKLHKNSRKILIIDQADVFFNENFFGRLYCPSLSLDDQQTKGLVAFIWRCTKQGRQNSSVKKVQKEQIYASNEFKKVAAKYPAIKDLLQNQVVGMLQAAYNFSHGYIVHQDSIKYRDNDSITDKISYGFKTVFANCFQYDRKAISQISYNSALKITLNIAPFSYSELPTFFQAILGVSGTVSSMSDYKKNMLRQRYGIEETYEIPSIYGLTQRTNDNFTIVKDEIFYDKIVEHTKNISQTGRPIALFFKTIKDVTNFYKSPQFKQFTKNTTILTEQTDHASRQMIIKRVGQRGKITVLTESFARGTDFKIFDKSINQIGGLHVIQTFISSDLSEYIQTRGRTARQGNKGSFQVLINETQLQKFEIICTQNSQFQQKMKNAWTKKDLSQCSELEQRVNKAREKHTATQSLFKKKPSQNEIIEFIYSHNKFNEIKKNHVRTLIGIDGTSSMGAALRKVIDILEDSFTRTKTILEKKNVPGSFQNKIGIYRNYNSDFEQILEYSGFEAESQKLQFFLQKIQINGGWGNEAMQVLLQHANQIDKLDQIIIIADAKSNNAAQTKYKRGCRHGQDYWTNHGFPITNETVEVLKIKQRKIKIHTLYIYLDSSNQQKRAELKKYCENISVQTGGTSEQFKIKEGNASQFLTGFLVKNILMLLGGQEKGRQLAESYDKDYSVPLRL